MNLPPEIFPDRSDETRVSFLFSEEAVDADTVAFWEHTLYAYSLHKTTAASLSSKTGKGGSTADTTASAASITFTCANVMDDFTVHDIIPTSIFKCTEALSKTSSLMKVSELKSYSSSDCSSSSSKSVTVWDGSKSLLFNSSLWVLNTVTNIVGGNENANNNSADGATNSAAVIHEEYISVKMFSEIECLISTFISNEANEIDCDESNPHYVGSCYYKEHDPSVNDRKFCFIGLLNCLVDKYESKACTIDISSTQNDKLVGAIKAIIRGSPESTRLLQNFLLKSKGATASKDGNVIKIKTALSTSGCSVVGEEEIAELTIASSICLLEAKLRVVDAEMAAHESRARQYVSDGNKTLAMQQLQLKKLKAQSKDTLSSYLVTLVSSQHQLQTSAITAVVKDSILATTNGLRAVRFGASLTEDSAMDAMDDLADEVEAMRDVGAALGSSSASGLDQSEDELLDELNDLMGAATLSGKETSGAAAAEKESNSSSSYDPSRVLQLLQSDPPPAAAAPINAPEKRMVAI